MPKKTVPGRDYEWQDGTGKSGVHTHEGQLVFWHRPGGNGGRFGEVARTQSFADFIANGSAVPIPDDVLTQLQKLLTNNP